MDRLKALDSHFRQQDYLEELEGITEIGELIAEINEYCENNRVLGIHYTRALPEEIERRGLLVRSGTEIRELFLKRHGHLFSVQEKTDMEAAWKNHTTKQAHIRDNRIWFNFTREALNHSGADLLLKNYGGEQVYFSIRDLPGIAEKISSIGEPLIVECSLNPREVKTYKTHPWGSIAVSSYHCSVNPRAPQQFDQDGSQTVPVLPEHVVKVTLYGPD